MSWFQSNFTEVFLLWPFTKIAKKALLIWTKWPPELKMEKKKLNISSFATGLISKWLHWNVSLISLCNVRPQDIVTTRSNELLARLVIEDLDLILKERRLQWCIQDSLLHTGWGKGWAWEAQDDMEVADREGLQRVEALDYQPSW